MGQSPHKLGLSICCSDSIAFKAKMPQDFDNSHQRGRFVTTSWSSVLKTRGSVTEKRIALDDLCRAYWYPLFVYARRRGKSAQDAEDSVQSFLTRLMESNVVERADPERGRFRSFLVTSFNQYLAREYEHNSAQKRCPPGRLVSIDAAFGDERYLNEPVHHESAEAHFERVWAQTVIERAAAQLQEEWIASGKEDKFRVLKGSLTNHQIVTCREMAQQLGMTEGAVRVALHRMKSRLGELLRMEVASTVENETQIDHELKLLLAALNRA